MKKMKKMTMFLTTLLAAAVLLAPFSEVSAQRSRAQREAAALAWQAEQEAKWYKDQQEALYLEKWSDRFLPPRKLITEIYDSYDGSLKTIIRDEPRDSRRNPFRDDGTYRMRPDCGY